MECIPIHTQLHTHTEAHTCTQTPKTHMHNEAFTYKWAKIQHAFLFEEMFIFVRRSFKNPNTILPISIEEHSARYWPYENKRPLTTKQQTPTRESKANKGHLSRYVTTSNLICENTIWGIT